MFLERLFDQPGIKIKNLATEAGSYAECYSFWSNILLERSLHLFHWETEGTPEHEVEKILMLQGMVGIARIKGEKDLVALYGQYGAGLTHYFDIYEDYMAYAPGYSEQLKVGSQVAVIWQNSLRNSIYPLIHRYATMLSHTEVSLVNTLINGRDSGGVPVASTETAKRAIEDYRNSLCNGRVLSIHDPAFATVEFKGINKNTALNIKELMEVRENLLNAYYQDLGIKTAWNKKGNMIVEEVNANDSMLLLNLSDMLEFRQRGCEEVNKLFGTNWSVRLNPVIEYANQEPETKEGPANDND